MQNQKHNKAGLGTFPLASPFNEISQKEAEKIIRTFIRELVFAVLSLFNKEEQVLYKTKFVEVGKLTCEVK